MKWISVFFVSLCLTGCITQTRSRIVIEKLPYSDKPVVRLEINLMGNSDG
jgi:hypothetical protein